MSYRPTRTRLLHFSSNPIYCVWSAQLPLLLQWMSTWGRWPPLGATYPSAGPLAKKLATTTHAEYLPTKHVHYICGCAALDNHNSRACKCSTWTIILQDTSWVAKVRYFTCVTADSHTLVSAKCTRRRLIAHPYRRFSSRDATFQEEQRSNVGNSCESVL